MEPCIPYGWQFKDEDVFMPSDKGKGLNLFGSLSRDNRFVFKTTRGKVDSSFIIEQLDALSFTAHKITVVVFDNVHIHTSAKVRACRSVREQRGLFIFYLPAYSPHLIETLWRKLKYEWLEPQDYLCKDKLFYYSRHKVKATALRRSDFIC